MLLTLILQITETATGAAIPTVAQEAPKEDTLSLFDLLLKGGYIMIPIGILSLVSIYVLIEKYLNIKKSGKYNSTLLENVFEQIKKGNLEGASSICKSNPSAISNVIDKGISRIGKPIKEIETAMEGIGKLEVAKMEKNLSILGIIAGIAPMFGFIGTISGVIKIFYNISLADNISIGLISGGLYEKMITSAAGLVVGVFAFVSYHYLNLMIDRNIYKIEASSIEFIDMLQDAKS
ncbi:MAG: MotA/TolQ/ExbB proton channel family protein [Bacteroidia bacterium]|nr:MotA/TolQ/ExbB proton channel family protein [Bacteroidia bacterium]MCZ2248978.1 MotA/TolQ/ExbB proton channel family protein [Bacteroidia bacterium]